MSGESESSTTSEQVATFSNSFLDKDPFNGATEREVKQMADKREATNQANKLDRYQQRNNLKGNQYPKASKVDPFGNKW